MRITREGKYGQGSDLALERMRAPTEIEGVLFTKEEKSLEGGRILSWERIKISSEEGAKAIGRPQGNYDTLSLERMDGLSPEEISEAARELSAELIHSVARLGVTAGRLLVIGIGNAALTPDSVGPRAAAEVNATLHISKYESELFEKMNCSEIAVIVPGVTAESGMDAAALAAAVSETLLPDAVIAIDSLAARSPARLGTTVQISDTGIFPGSGIGNGRRPLNESTLGAPVIAIGVPTVINAGILIGADGEGECTPHDTDGLFVSPKDIDAITDVSSKIIADGINQAFGIF